MMDNHDSQKEYFVRHVNVAVMGHVDCGKTSLVRALFTHKGGTLSTAALDKHPESQRRGITIDLGFTSLDISLGHVGEVESIARVCFVDCPGHASLLRTVLGAAQIIDCILLVFDVTKGIQAQTLECIVVAEITAQRIILVLNKIDLLPQHTRASKVSLVHI